MRNIEIETKYDANHVTVQQFKELIGKHIYCSFYSRQQINCYFTNASGEYIRYRNEGAMCELTVKKNMDGIQEREEINLPLSFQTCSLQDVVDFLETIGYHRDFSTMKFSEVALVPDAEVTYDAIQSGDTFRHFIEIEAKAKNKEDAWKIIERYEDILSKIGVTSENRLQKSTHDMLSTRK